MDPVALAGLLKDYGPWGLVALSALAIRSLNAALRESERGRLADAHAHAQAVRELIERCAAVLERAAGTMAAVGAALESRTGIFERLSGLVEEIKGLVRDLQRDSTTADERVREKMDANASRLDALVARIDALRHELHP
jgi:hypothetical protein